MKWPILPIYFSLLTACSALEQPKLLPKPINVCNYHPTFGLTNIYTYSYLIYSTPAHLAVSQGFINFTFSDSASQSPGLCQGSSNTPFDFFRGDRDYPCLQAAPDTSSFRYISGGDFKINSTWTCVEPWQNTTKIISAYGAGKVRLNCTSVDQVTPGWTPGTGQIYRYSSISCSAPQLILAATITGGMLVLGNDTSLHS